MAHNPQDLTGALGIHKGDDISPTISVLDAADAEVDISAATEITWVMARQPGGSALIMKLLSTAGITLVGGIGNEHKFRVVLEPDDTKALPDGFYYHEAEVALAGSDSTVIHGSVELSPASVPNP